MLFAKSKYTFSQVFPVEFISKYYKNHIIVFLNNVKLWLESNLNKMSQRELFKLSFNRTEINSYIT